MKPYTPPLHEAARRVRTLLRAEACSLYVAQQSNGEKEFLFAGCDGASETLAGPGPDLGRPSETTPWLGLTSYVAYHGVPVRIDDLGGKREVEIEVDGALVSVRIDRKSCELEDPGPFLAVALQGEDGVIGVVRLLRRHGQPSFSKEDEQRLSELAPFLALSAYQERERRELVRGLLDLAQRSGEGDVFEAIVHTALLLVGGDEHGAAVFLEDPLEQDDEPVFTFRAPVSSKGQIEVDRYRESSEGLTAEVIKTGRPILSTNLRRDLAPEGCLAHVNHQSKGGEVRKGKTRSWVGVPIGAPGEANRVLGVIRVSSEKPHLFSRRDVDTLVAIAEQTRWILQNLWGRDTLFRTLVDTTEDPIVAIDNEGRIKVFNPAVQRIFGLSEEQAKGKTVVEALYDGELDRARDTMRAIRRNGGKLKNHYTTCFRPCPETGERIVIPVRVNASLMTSGGKVIGSIGILEDLRGPHAQNRIVEFGEHAERGSQQRRRTGWTLDARQADELRKLDGLTPNFRQGPIHITGESGSGKELVFEMIGEITSPEHPPRKVNCASLKDELIEVELFGSVAGAFTGATNKRGIFDPRVPTAILLDEISELPLPSQAKLLRTLDRSVIRRVGSPDEETVDVQVVTATLDDLESLVAQETFRKDLFFRLKGLTIRMLPLRERRADILQIAERVLEEQRNGQDLPRSFSSETIEAFLAHDWPGNVRELRMAIEQAVVRFRSHGTGKLLELDLFPRAIQTALRRPSNEDDLRARIQKLEDQLRNAGTKTLATRTPRLPESLASLPSASAIAKYIVANEPELSKRIRRDRGVLQDALAKAGKSVQKSQLSEIWRANWG